MRELNEGWRIGAKEERMDPCYVIVFALSNYSPTVCDYTYDTMPDK